MGIYDREYVRNRRAGSGATRPMRTAMTRHTLGLSITTWLIIANIAVALLRIALVNFGHPVLVGHKYFDGVNPSAYTQIAEHPTFLTSSALPQNVDPTRIAGNVVERRLIGTTREGAQREIGRSIYSVMDPLSRFGHFSTITGFAQLEVWRLVTFQFLHSGFLHLAFNMFGLWVFGRIVEEQLGGKRYLAFYLTCGIFGGLLYLVLNLAGYIGLKLPGALSVQIATPLVGASAGVFGVLMACAYIAPKTIVQLIFPPIPIQMRYLVYGFFALSVWNLLTGAANQGGEAAHVGGALAGYFFIRRAYLLNDFFEVFRRSSKTAAKPARPKPSGSSKKQGDSDAEIDRILDKISREGISGLDDAERKTLAQHSKNERQDRTR